MPEPTLSQRIATMLDAVRPDRYEAEDKTWMAPVEEQVAFEIDNATARAVAAKQMVRRVEGDATKRTNRLLREIAESGQVPLDWFEAISWPLAIDGHNRVALRAVTAADLKEFAANERRSAANEFASRNEACEGALKLADLLGQHVGIAAIGTITEQAS